MSESTSAFREKGVEIALVNSFPPAKSFYLARALSAADRALRLVSNKEAFFPLLFRSLGLSSSVDCCSNKMK